ncbi:MAG TPA: DUF983 domain-containing protein [Gemmatimonadaceae bacterium]
MVRRRVYETTLGGILRLLGRAFLRRCPRCGVGGIFATWFRFKPECPTCGLALDRGEHFHWLGAYTINLIVAELGAAALIVAFMLSTWPDVPWETVTWVGVALVVVLPILFYPYARTVWLALDLAFRDRN